MSARTSAKAPTVPVASAAIRSIRRGLIRALTWLFPRYRSVGSSTMPNRKPIAITAIAPPITRATLRPRWDRSARTIDRAVPRIGVIRGATIIAPITVAVESATTPADAMIAARSSRTQKREEARPPTGPSMNAAPVMRSTSATETAKVIDCSPVIRCNDAPLIRAPRERRAIHDEDGGLIRYVRAESHVHSWLALVPLREVVHREPSRSSVASEYRL